jgi:hypothetical protein
MIVAYSVVALIIGLSIYDSIAGTDSLGFLRNARGSYLISAVIMTGTVIMLIGAVFSFKKYQNSTQNTIKIITKGQIDYLNDVLKIGDSLSETERKNIKKKISDLSKQNTLV